MKTEIQSKKSSLQYPLKIFKGDDDEVESLYSDDHLEEIEPND